MITIVFKTLLEILCVKVNIKMKKLEGFEVEYFYNELGELFNSSGKKLKEFTSDKGYITFVCLKTRSPKRYSPVLKHRLIAFYNLPNPSNYKMVNHKDGNKLNNSIDNLEWCSCAQNNKHAYDTGLKKPKRHFDDCQVLTILTLSQKYGGNKELSEHYNVCHQVISDVNKGRNYPEFKGLI